MFRKIFLLLVGLILSSSVYSQVTRKTEGTPVIGDKYEMTVQLTSNRKIILPQGIWEVNNVFDDRDPYLNTTYKVITFTNTNEDSPFRILVTRVFLQSSSRWPEEFCEKKSDSSAIGLFKRNNIFGFLKTNNISGKNICGMYSIWDDPQKMIKTYLPNLDVYFKKAFSNLVDDQIKTISKNAIYLQILANRTGDLYIRQEMIIDPFALGINGEQFKSRYNDNTSEPVARMASWRDRYIAKMIDAFYAGKEPVTEDVTLVPLSEKTIVAASTEPEQPISTKPNNLSANANAQVNSELKIIEEERRKLDEERQLFNEQKALAEERKKFEEEKRQFELAKQNNQPTSTKSVMPTDPKSLLAEELNIKSVSEKTSMTDDKPKPISAEEKRQQSALAKKLDLEEKQRVADEKKRAEEDKKAEVALAKKLEKDEKQRLADEKKKADEDKKAEVALARKLELEEKQRLADEKKKADEEKKAEAKAIKDQEIAKERAFKSISDPITFVLEKKWSLSEKVPCTENTFMVYSSRLPSGFANLINGSNTINFNIKQVHKFTKIGPYKFEYASLSTSDGNDFIQPLVQNNPDIIVSQTNETIELLSLDKIRVTQNYKMIDIDELAKSGKVVYEKPKMSTTTSSICGNDPSITDGKNFVDSLIPSVERANDRRIEYSNRKNIKIFVACSHDRLPTSTLSMMVKTIIGFINERTDSEMISRVIKQYKECSIMNRPIHENLINNASLLKQVGNKKYYLIETGTGMSLGGVN